MRTRISVLLILALLVSVPVFGATCYVDPTLSADCDGTNYHYVPTNAEGARRVAGPGAKATNTFQAMCYGTGRVAQAGDTIYLRGGTYTENYGETDHGAAMAVSFGLNGTSWTEGNYTTIASYPGEWAIIDAQGATKFALGWGSNDQVHSSESEFHRYIKYERLGVTGGREGGICWIGGPVWVRYCAIYTNGYPESDTNKGGVYATTPQDSIVEYCEFYNNGGTQHHNNAQVMFYSDYLARSALDFGASMHNTKVRYNYFHGPSMVCIKDKAEQFLGLGVTDSGYPGIVNDDRYKNQGNEYAYNIFEDAAHSGVYGRQDWQQIHHNIANNCPLTGDNGNDYPPVHYRCFYNNTVQNSFIADTCGANITYDPFGGDVFIANNIVTDYGYTTTYGPSIQIFCRWFAASCTHNYTWARTLVDRNFIYRPESSYHFGLPNSTSCNSTRYLSTSAFNTNQTAIQGYTIQNYTNSTAGLFGTGAAGQYKTSGSFVLTGSTTIANGGYNNAHPYLDDVTIPDYVGATDPDDIATNDWVTGVLGLNATYFTSVTGGTDPDWIAESEAGEESPSTPSITGVLTGSIR